MPRFENGGDAVHAWSRETHCPSTTFDVCSEHAAGLEGARPSAWPDSFEERLQDGEPMGLLCGDVEHPPYDGAGARCDVCEKPLTRKDD